jgi:hypothetical protein
VIEDKKRGLVARIEPTGAIDRTEVEGVLGQFATGWEWAD